MKYLEQEIQKTLVRHLRQRGVPGLVFWHTPNGAYLGGKRNRRGHVIQRGILAGMGARAGVSDLTLLHKSRLYCLELKAPGKTPDEDQLKFLADADAAGAFTAWTDSLDRAIKIVETWGLVRGMAHGSV